MLGRGIVLAELCGRKAPVERWSHLRDVVRREIEQRGYNSKCGTFVQVFDRHALDAALLLSPMVGFVAYDDERMIGTADAIMAGLDQNGLVLRYHDKKNDNPFLACTFWLAECLAR
jgi:GH15 family glucan-1,4-alpha-glucosidase